MSLEQKRCTKCGVIKELSDFHKSIAKKDGRKSACKVCSKTDNRKAHLKLQYGIDYKTYEQLLNDQNGCCALCGTDVPGRGYANFAVDHNHKTGEVRGLLCYHCNLGLGHFKDSPGLIKRAIQYLEENGHYGAWTDA